MVDIQSNHRFKGKLVVVDVVLSKTSCGNAKIDPLIFENINVVD